MIRALPLLLLPLAGCGGPDTSPKPAIPVAALPDAPVAVTAVAPKRQTLAWAIEQPGTVHPFEVTPVVAKLSGFVTKVNADLGDEVIAGQVLAEVSIPELDEEKKQKVKAVELADAEVTQAERAADEAEARMASVEAMAAEAKAALGRLDADVARWDGELRRVSGLVTDRVLDGQIGDETRKQASAARAAKAEGDAKLASANALTREAVARKGRAVADVAAAKAKKGVAEAEVNRLTALLKYTQIRAPFAGVVTARTVHTGHYLPAAGHKADALFVVARMDPVRVFVEVPEGSAAAAAVGAPATVRVPALKNREFAGTVTRTAKVLNGESRTLKVEIDLPNKGGELTAGAFVNVKIGASATDALTVPAAAVLFADETAYCFLVENGRAVKVRVQVGHTQAGVIEVLNRRRAGVTTDPWTPFTGSERVVVGKLGELPDGQPVTEK